MKIEGSNRFDVLCKAIGLTPDDSSFHQYQIFEAVRQFAVMKSDSEMKEDLDKILSILPTIGLENIERHYALVATTWCVDSADAMFQWCSTVPGMNIVRKDSHVNRTHTLALFINEPNIADIDLRSLFLEALLENEHLDDEPRWSYVEMSYGTGGPSVERAFPVQH